MKICKQPAKLTKGNRSCQPFCHCDSPCAVRGKQAQPQGDETISAGFCKTTARQEKTIEGLPVYIPQTLAARYGWQGGEMLQLQENGDHLKVLPPVSRLRKVYVEATNVCNLACVMCIRNSWQESSGFMTGKIVTVTPFPPAQGVYTPRGSCAVLEATGVAV